jgi:hypothetical protein
MERKENTISQYNVPIKKYISFISNRMVGNGSIWYARRDGRKRNGAASGMHYYKKY